MGQCVGFQDQEAELQRIPMSRRCSDQLLWLKSTEVYKIDHLA